MAGYATLAECKRRGDTRNFIDVQKHEEARKLGQFNLLSNPGFTQESMQMPARLSAGEQPEQRRSEE